MLLIKIIKTLLIFAIISMILSCSENDEQIKNQEQEVENFEEIKKDSSTTSSKVITEFDYEFRGFIDTMPITIKLKKQDNTKVIGEYLFTKYNKKIELLGEFEVCSDCGGEGTSCRHLKLFEKVNDDITGSWFFECFDSQIYNYPNLYHETLKGIWQNGNNKNKISLITETSKKYLDAKSSFIFNSKKECDEFFKVNIINNHEIDDKRFYIMAKNPEDQYLVPLPIGINILEFNGMEPDNYKLDSSGKYNNENNEFSVWDLPNKKISNELYTIVMSKIIQINYGFQLEHENFQISVDSLNNSNFYILDEHSFLLRNSVLGYFPAIDPLNFYEKPNESSKILFQDANEETGMIEILEIKQVNFKYWAKVKFNYYKEVPCSEEIRVPKPSIEGWIKLQDENQELTISYYPGGC